MNTKHFTIAALTALALSIAPAANAADKGCSNATLKGTFSDKDSGWIYTSPTAAPLAFAGVNVDTFDGNGNLTISGTSSVAGSVSPGTLTGTYKVNPDCTGTYSVGSGTIHAFFVIDESGDEIQIIITDQGNVILCVARRQFPVGDLETITASGPVHDRDVQTVEHSASWAGAGTELYFASAWNKGNPVLGGRPSQEWPYNSIPGHTSRTTTPADLDECLNR